MCAVPTAQAKILPLDSPTPATLSLSLCHFTSLQSAFEGSKIGHGDRSEKIRTYNYPQNRVTDHRIGFTIQQLDRVMEGKIDSIIEALVTEDQKRALSGEQK